MQSEMACEEMGLCLEFPETDALPVAHQGVGYTSSLCSAGLLTDDRLDGVAWKAITGHDARNLGGFVTVNHHDMVEASAPVPMLGKQGNVIEDHTGTAAHGRLGLSAHFLLHQGVDDGFKTQAGLRFSEYQIAHGIPVQGLLGSHE